MSLIRAARLDEVNPSTYNPRTADQERLDLIELSLRKLGFLLPIVADASGEILSGHQRHLIASRMGLAQVPVLFTKAMPLNERKSLNIAFNRGTNDMAAVDTPASMTEALARVRVDDLAAQLPDRGPGGMMRCLHTEEVPVSRLTAANVGRWVHYAKNTARALAQHGIVMPMVCTRDLKVVNGIGRLEYAAEQGWESLQVVWVTETERDLVHAMLNYLTMDFNIHERYQDLLRFNSFRRAFDTRKYLGRAFTFPIVGSKSSNTFDVTREADRERWVKRFGTTVLDFGAGTLCETKLLRQVGIDAVPFEPYRLCGREIDKDLSVETTRRFLRRVREGVEFDSIFLSAIMNSVPFYEDRRHILRIIAALCGPRTRVYAVSASVRQTGYRLTAGKEYLNEGDASRLQFRLDYEPRVTIADFSNNPKVQKYHTTEEWYQLWKNQFSVVKVTTSANNVECQCAQAIAPSDGELEAALRFEFELPYPDGSTMGLSAEALEAFHTRFKGATVS